MAMDIISDITLTLLGTEGEFVQIYTITEKQENYVYYCQTRREQLFNEPITIKSGIRSEYIKKILTLTDPIPLPNFIFNETMRIYNLKKKINNEININEININEIDRALYMKSQYILKNMFCKGIITDTSLANLFYCNFPKKYIYDLSSKTWISINNYGIYSWDDSKLVSAKKLLTTDIFNLIKSYYYAEINKLSKQDALTWSKTYNKIEEYIGMSNKQNNIIEAMQTFYCDKNIYEKLDSVNNYVIGFNNGVYDLKNNIFRNADPNELISCSTGYDYNIIDEIYIKIIEELLENIFPDPEEKAYIVSVLSLGLVGVNENEDFHFFEGSGGNGKGLLETLTRLTLGDYCGTIDGKHFYKNNNINPKSASPELASNKNSRIVFVNELNSQQDLEDTLIKKITGRDPIECRDLYKGLFKYVAKYSLIFLSNWKLKIDCSDEANVRRIKYESFPNKFVENPIQSNHRKLNIKLKEDINENVNYRLAFFHVLLKYYNIYVKNGNKLTIPKRFKDETDKFIGKSDPIGEFIKDCIIENPKKIIKSSDLYKAFNKYNEDESNISTTLFKQILEKKGYKSIKNSCVIYKGICFVNDIKEKIEDFDHLDINESSIDNN
ncbi:DNA primase [Acanthamoeba polyphaga mimivirus]|uniref:DNA primase n=1 Tax=Acanthamoeba polyphaga mimivirus TaxID=212035 RepID=A0A2L2DL00_MIMIV|nr:DNA primase [Acanthamoeba polyphaga mimivirus]